MNDRTQGVTLQVIDTSKIEADLTAELREEGRIATDETVSLTWQWAVGTDSKGRTYLLCDEGVGGKADVVDGVPSWEFEVWTESPRKADGSKSISIFPRFLSRIPLAEMPMTGEQVDLADFIRVFGARLESNFWLWHRALS